METNQPTDIMRDGDPFPFGKHKGTKMKDVPADYLDWLRGQPWIGQWPLVDAYIKRNKSVIDYELENEPERSSRYDWDEEKG